MRSNSTVQVDDIEVVTHNKQNKGRKDALFVELAKRLSSIIPKAHNVSIKSRQNCQ
jgi:hypothetical protein